MSEGSSRVSDVPFTDWRWASLVDGIGAEPDGDILVGTSMLSERNLLPIMAVREPALQHNIELMAAWCTRHGAKIAPHAKTTMSRQIIARQSSAGAWGMTAATVTQARTLLSFGVRRLLIANTLANPVAIGWLSDVIAERPDVEVPVFADSLAAVNLLDAHFAAADATRRLDVLVELGLPGRRTGVRDGHQAVAIAREVSRRRQLRLAGVSAYEGVVDGDRQQATLDDVQWICESTTEVVAQIFAHGLFEMPDPVVSIGGSAYLDVVSAHWSASSPSGYDPRLILRSGCYVTHDHGLYQRMSAPMPDGGLQPALELWAQVISVPEPDLFVVGAGRRECPDDSGGPTVLRAFRSGAPYDVGSPDFVKMYDHHAVFKSSSQLPQVGDVVVLGISHPCSAFSRWRTLPLLEPDDTVSGVVHSYV